MPDTKDTVPSQTGKRDEKGRFVKGGPAGPGRPRASAEEISTKELIKLAQPLGAGLIEILALQIQFSFEALDNLKASNVRADVIAAVEVEVNIQQLASIALRKRLHALANKSIS